MRVPALLDVVDEVEHRRHLVDAHAGGRLVEHEDLRLHGDQNRDFELALVAMRKGLRRDVALVGERARVRRTLSALLDQIAVGVFHTLNSDQPAPARLCTARRTFSSARELRKQIGELESAAQPAPRARGGGKARDVLAVER